MSPLPVFVGEHPPPGAPWAGPWEGQSGTRLAHLAGLEGRGALFELAEGAHLVDRPGERLRALREAAAALARRVSEHPLVLCGGRVAEAFGVDSKLYRLRWTQVEVGGRTLRVASIPFPSGRCPSYADPKLLVSARAFLRETLGISLAGRFTALHPSEMKLTLPDPDEQLLDYAQAARFLGVSVGCLRVRIHRGVGPPVIRMGPRSVRFRERDLRAWMQRVTVLPAVGRRKAEAK